MERDQAKKIIEALLYMTDHALTEREILSILEQKSFDENDVKEMVREIAAVYDANQSPLRVIEVAGGIQMATRQEISPWIRKLYKERLTVRLSPSSLETLAIIAYKQPITRGEIEQIRGVEATGVMETLLERRLVKVVGRKETIGRPLLYGTTTEFLKHCGLRHLAELPDLSTLVASTEPPKPEDDRPSEGASQPTFEEVMPGDNVEPVGAEPPQEEAVVEEETQILKENIQEETAVSEMVEEGDPNAEPVADMPVEPAGDEGEKNA